MMSSLGPEKGQLLHFSSSNALVGIIVVSMVLIIIEDLSLHRVP